MEQDKNNLAFEQQPVHPDETKHRFPIEADSDTLEPFIDENEHRIIDVDDPNELRYWAGQFQISSADLKAAIVLNGNSVKEIKKFLSI